MAVYPTRLFTCLLSSKISSKPRMLRWKQSDSYSTSNNRWNHREAHKERESALTPSPNIGQLKAHNITLTHLLEGVLLPRFLPSLCRQFLNILLIFSIITTSSSATALITACGMFVLLWCAFSTSFYIFTGLHIQSRDKKYKHEH